MHIDLLYNETRISFEFLFRIKQRTLAQMENDLLYEKVFDMLIQLKDISIVLPENGFYEQ